MKTDPEEHKINPTVGANRGGCVVNADPRQFEVGEKFGAIVKCMRTEAIEVLGGYLGMVFPRCWGVGVEYPRTLANVFSGGRLDVAERFWAPAAVLGKLPHTHICEFISTVRHALPGTQIPFTTDGLNKGIILKMPSNAAA